MLSFPNSETKKAPHLAGSLIVLAGVVLFVLLTAGTPVATEAPGLSNPRRVVEGLAGQLLVSDRSGSIVAVDAGTLEPVWGFALPNEGAPYGLATWRTLLYVGNTESHNVEVYRMQGPTGRLRFEYNLGLIPEGQPGPFGNPISIDVDEREHLVFVLDGTAKTIRTFDRRGDELGTWAPVDRDGRVLSPVALALDATRREVLVADYGDPSGFFRSRRPARILIYDYDGALQFQIDGNGRTHGSTRFARLQGLAVGADGRIFATDPLGGRILVLDRTSGALLAEIGTEGPAPGQLMLPLDVYLDDARDDLFVVNNRGARKLEVFRAVGRTP